MWRRRKTRTYLDLAAGVAGNPSSPHAEGRAARAELERARLAIARLVECKNDDILFTGGATEANALAILGVIRAARSAGGAGFRPHALYFAGSHASIVENMQVAEREGAVVESLPVRDCRIDCTALAKMIRPETVLVSIEAVDGETGIIWNTREIARTIVEVGLLQKQKSDFYRAMLHVDASQAPWTQMLTRAHFGADLMTLDASKVSAARGIGCLVASRRIPLSPLYGGGGQERGLVPGSEAPFLATAFAEGLARRAAECEAFCTAAFVARKKLITTIYGGVPGVVVNESPHAQAPNILNLSLPGRDTDYLVALLDEAGFAVSTKSACESASGEGSRAVLALWGDRARAAATLRVSWGPTTHERDLERFAAALIHAVRFVDSGGDR